MPGRGADDLEQRAQDRGLARLEGGVVHEAAALLLLAEERRAPRQLQGASGLRPVERLELDGHAERPRTAARIEDVRHLVREMRDVRLFAREDGRETVGKGLGALPTHGGENRARLRKGQRRPILHRMSAGADLRRLLPSVEQMLQRTEVRALEARHGRALVVRELRALVEDARTRAAAGDRAAVESVAADLPARLAARLDRARAASLIPVLNATGVVVHTNLGRSRLAPEVAEQVARIATSYSNLEFDLAEGDRGQREVHAETRLRALVGTEAAVVVNNNAAAVLLAVNTFAEGREVLVSRSELVEIGGSFRIPDVLRKGGARLREVGTTNRTRAADYRDALGPDTGLILKVHPSNFRIVGFTEAPSRGELVALAREAGVPMVEDLGSGLLAPLAGLDETTVAESLRGGVDVVTFSGDKLLGGSPGRSRGRGRGADRRHAREPLYRALRVDKMTLAALDAVLVIHESGRAATDLPTLRMLA